MKLVRGLGMFPVLFLFLHLSAKAATSVYGAVAATNYGYAYNNSQNLIYSPDHFGVGLGAFYRFPIQSRLSAGIDARFYDTPSSFGGNKGFVSARFGFVPHRNPLRPYLQIGGGYIHTRIPGFAAPFSPKAITVPALDFAFGLDVRLNSSFDWRPVELEGGAGVKGPNTAGSASLSTGLVYHFGG